MGGHAAVAALRDSQTTDTKSTNYYSSHALLRQTAPVPSYIRARPDAGHRGERRGYLALADATRPATRPCSSRGHSDEASRHGEWSLKARGRPRAHIASLGMSHICCCMHHSIQKLAISPGDETILDLLGAYTCRRLSFVKAYHRCLCPFCTYRPRKYQSSEHVLIIVLLPLNCSSDPLLSRPSLLFRAQS